jgi:Flp pilus assembly protein TadG
MAGVDRLPLLRGVKRLIEARRGAVALMMALALPVLIGAAGLSVDAGLWYVESTRLQMAADAGAMGAAFLLQTGDTNTADYVTAATHEIQGITGGYLVGALTLPPSLTLGPGQQVTVSLTSQSDRFFTKLFSTAPVTMTASATAGLEAGGACVLALGTSPETGIDVENNGTIVASQCGVFSNSLTNLACSGPGAPSYDSIYVRNGSITAKTISAAGTACIDTWNGNTTASPAPVSGLPPLNNPLAALPAPSTSGPCLSSPQGHGTWTLQPGVYCNGLSIGNASTVTFEPGLYVILNGNFTISEGSTIASAAGVTFYLGGTTPGAIDFENYTNTAWQMSAPTSGPYAGVLFFQDQGASGSPPANTIVGNSGLTLAGTIYTPYAPLQVTNNAHLAYPSGQNLGEGQCPSVPPQPGQGLDIIAQSIEVQGSAVICAGGTTANAAVQTRVVLLQ